MSGLHDPPLGESDTRSKLINPGTHGCGWTEEHIRREETAAAIEIIDGKPRRRTRSRVDCTLRAEVSSGDQPVALAVIEVKAEHLPPGNGLEQTKSYARCKRLNVRFAFFSSGHMFISPPPPEPPEGPGTEPPPPPPPPEPRITVAGFDVEVTEVGHSIAVEALSTVNGLIVGRWIAYLPSADDPAGPIEVGTK